MRWEWFQQAINLLHDRTVAQQTGPNPFWDPTLPLDRTTIPHIPQDLNNFSPVVGFAWTPRMLKGFFGEDKTVIRAGFRIGYDPSFYNMFLNTATRSPVVNAGTIPGGPGIPATGNGADAQAELVPLVPTGAGIDPGFRSQTLVSRGFHNPYSQQWNLGIQRSIGQRIAAEVRYVGNLGLHQWLADNLNEVNIFENGFLPEFQHAQANLTINQANGKGASFANNGLPGQVPLPIFVPAGPKLG